MSFYFFASSAAWATLSFVTSPSRLALATTLHRNSSRERSRWAAVPRQGAEGVEGEQLARAFQVGRRGIRLRTGGGDLRFQRGDVLGPGAGGQHPQLGLRLRELALQARELRFEVPRVELRDDIASLDPQRSPDRQFLDPPGNPKRQLDLPPRQDNRGIDPADLRRLRLYDHRLDRPRPGVSAMLLLLLRRLAANGQPAQHDGRHQGWNETLEWQHPIHLSRLSGATQCDCCRHQGRATEVTSLLAPTGSGSRTRS